MLNKFVHCLNGLFEYRFACSYFLMSFNRIQLLLFFLSIIRALTASESYDILNSETFIRTDSKKTNHISPFFLIFALNYTFYNAAKNKNK